MTTKMGRKQWRRAARLHAADAEATRKKLDEVYLQLRRMAEREGELQQQIRAERQHAGELTHALDKLQAELNKLKRRKRPAKKAATKKTTKRGRK